MKHIKTFESSEFDPKNGISVHDVWVIYRRRDTEFGYHIFLNKADAEAECEKTNNNLKKMTGFVGPVENYLYSVYTLDDAVDYIKDVVKDNEFLNSREGY